jgi:prolyl-tRNA synthetase
MRLSQGYWQTLKEVPKDAEVASHVLLARAGFIDKSGGGIYTYLPMAVRVLRKIENIIREELDAINCFEITCSVVTPGELWKETGRWDDFGDLMLKFQDRAKRDLCISPTNEEAVTDLFRKTVSSYKQLPVTLYQINTKFRDEIRPRFGLMRGREFTMKDAYSFHLDKKSLDEVYENLYQAYSNIFTRMGLEFIIVEADGGAIASGDQKTHEFQVVANTGEDVVIYAKETGYAANIEKAKTLRSSLDFLPEQTMCEVETIGMQSCEEVAKFLGLPIYQTLKTLVYTATYGVKEVHYMLLLLGDDELNEVKLKNFLKADHVQIASEATLGALALPKGYMSPYGLADKISVVLDEAIEPSKSFVVGANKENYHIKGFTPQRDIQSNKLKVADIRMSKSGDLTLDGKAKVELKRGIEVGHIFQLGDKYSKSMNATVLDQNGKKIVPLMGCYGIGVTRTMAAAIEQNHDENGIIWPAAIAPYHVYLAVIAKKDSTKALATEIYQSLIKNKIETILDDRGAGPGSMFKDADLLGLPLRVTLGERDYEESQEFEVKVRKTGETKKVKVDDLVMTIQELLKSL